MRSSPTEVIERFMEIFFENLSKGDNRWWWEDTIKEKLDEAESQLKDELLRTAE